jgi:hypothetical protein
MHISQTQRLPLHSSVVSILEAGVLAPSGDNHHCFEVQASSDSIRLFGNRAYMTAPYHRRVLSLLSFGAVIENMSIRAARLGYQTSVAWHPDGAEPALIAQMTLTKGEPVASALDLAIARRHTNRGVFYSGPKLTEAELKHFQQALVDIEGVRLDFFDSRGRRAKLLRLITLAEAERFNTRSLHEDLFSSVRFDVGWHATADEGLPPGALGVEPGMRWAFAQLRRWSVMKVLRRIGFHRVLGFRAAYLPCRLAPHCGVLTTRLPLERGALAVGRALQRSWLEAESRGLAFQPFAGAALLALAEYREVPSETGERLRQGWRELTDETPLMVFRLGHASPPSVRTRRPTLASLLRA